MGHDRGDGVSFDFQPNGIPFGSKSKGKLSPRPYPIQFEKKWKHNFLNATQNCLLYFYSLKSFFLYISFRQFLFLPFLESSETYEKNI